MSDETKNNPLVETEESSDPMLEAASDLLLDSTIPVPLRRGIVQALNRLGGGLIDIPAGFLERRDAEKRAESEERIKFTRAVNRELMDQIKTDPEFTQRASNTFAHRILREQLNLEKTFRFAMGLFKKKEYDNSENQKADIAVEKPISEDWFNIFEKETSQKSTEEMQRRFGKVLAGEIEKPGSHSIKAIEVLGDMDQRVAMLFNTFCSLCIVNSTAFRQSPSNFKIRDARVPIITGIMTFSGNFQHGVGEFAQKAEAIYQRYGFGNDEFQLLLERGLIRDVNTYTEYSSFLYDDDFLRIIKLPSTEGEFQPPRISGYSLSSVGKELFHITKRINLPGHLELLIDFLQECYNVNIVRV